MYRYHSISARLLDIAPRLGGFRMLPLHGIAFDDIKRLWRHRKMCYPFMQNLNPSSQTVVLTMVAIKMTSIDIQ